MVIDGASKSISTGVVHGHQPYNLKGYGICCEDTNVTFDRMSEEHGILYAGKSTNIYKIGDTISFIPSHVCPTVNRYDTAYIKNEKDIRKIEIDARGRV